MLPVGIFPNRASKIHNKPCKSCDMFDNKRLYVVSVVSHWQSVSYSSTSICHACFQSKRITASSPDKYMSMKFCIRSVLNLRQIDSLQLCKFVYNFKNKFAIYLDKFIANLSRYEVFRMTKFTKIYASLYNSFKR